MIDGDAPCLITPNRRLIPVNYKRGTALRKVLNTPLRAAVAISVLAAAVVFGVTACWDWVSSTILPNTVVGLYEKEFWEGFLVEVHGIVFELSVLGVLFIWLDQRREERQAIAHLKSQVEDYSNIDSEETNVRKVGSLKRLNEHGITDFGVQNLVLNKVSLEGLKVNDAKWIGLKLSEGKISGSQFYKTNLRSSRIEHTRVSNTRFDCCNLYKASFSKSNCKGVSFEGCELRDSDFSDCNLQNGTFKHADVGNAKFSNANLNHCSFVGARNVNACDLAAADSLDYIKVDQDCLERLKQLRPDMRYQGQRKGRPRGNRTPTRE